MNNESKEIDMTPDMVYILRHSDKGKHLFEMLSTFYRHEDPSRFIEDVIKFELENIDIDELTITTYCSSDTTTREKYGRFINAILFAGIYNLYVEEHGFVLSTVELYHTLKSRFDTLVDFLINTASVKCND